MVVDGVGRRELARGALFLVALLGGGCASRAPSRLSRRSFSGEARSADGTRLAITRGGSGPPLLLVHGAVADHTTAWRLVLPALERSFTVYAMDRRGRGRSGDGPRYALAREAEDIAAVLDAIGPPVHVLGHSFGGLCAFEASRLGARMRRLVVYEGVPLHGSDAIDEVTLDRLEALLAAGDVEGMLVAMLHDVAKMAPEEIELLRGQREAWATRLRNAATVPRELRAKRGYTFVAERFRDLSVPVRFLVGEKSPEGERTNLEAIASKLPDASVTVLAGQAHLAMQAAPARFVEQVERLLLG